MFLFSGVSPTVANVCESCVLENHPSDLYNINVQTTKLYFDKFDKVVASNQQLPQEEQKSSLGLNSNELISFYFEEVIRRCEDLKTKVLNAGWLNNEDACYYPNAKTFAQKVGKEIQSVQSNNDNPSFFYIGYTERAPIDYLCTSGSKSKSEVFIEGYKHLHRIGFHFTKQAVAANEKKLIKEYGPNPHVINTTSSNKDATVDGYVYFVVFAKRLGCVAKVEDIKTKIFEAKPDTLKKVANANDGGENITDKMQRMNVRK
jgi:hypothetical protein